MLLFVSLTAAAQDGVRIGCRRGTHPPKMLSHRSLLQKEGGAEPCYFGKQHQLVVLASFTDKSFVGDEAATIMQWEKIFNAENFTEAPFVGSVHDYFYDQSYGQFNLTFDLKYVSLDNSIVKYRSTGANGDDENSQYLVCDVVDVLEQYDIDWSLYDWNGDGYVNQLLIVFPGKGQNDGGGTNSIWPHQWWLSWHEKDRQPYVYCEPRLVEYDGKTFAIDCYCALNELSGNGDYGSFGTICHEYSHCFGLPDFYFGNSSVVKDWDLMDYGNYNGGGFCPCGYSAHERMLMGWLTPQELTAETTISGMDALHSSADAYLVRNDAFPQEYYIIENRQQRGWDAALPGSGLLIFHIDYDEDEWEIGMPNLAQNKRYTLFHANNIQTTSTEADWPYPYGNNNSLTNDSQPAAIIYHANDDGQEFMSKPITNISVDNGLASFDFTVGGASAVVVPKYSKLHSPTLYTLDGCRVQTPISGQIYLVRGDDGKVMKTVYRYAK